MLEPVKLLKTIEPFKELPEKEINFLAKNTLADYVKRDTEILKEGEQVDYLYIIVKGSCTVKKGDKVVDVLEKGDFFGDTEIIFEEPSRFTVKAAENSILYMISRKAFKEVLKSYPEFREFFTKTTIERLSEGYRKILPGAEDTVSLLPVKEMKLSPAIFCEREENVKSVAEKMVEAGTSCCLVKGKETGIITDMDLKTKVVAKGLSPLSVKAEEIATYPVMTVESNDFVFEAIVKMVNSGVKRLPVVENGKIIGILEDRTIFIQQTKNFVFLAREIEAERDVKNLKRLFISVEEAIEALFKSGKDIVILQRYISEINDKFIRKAVDLAIEKVGEPEGEFDFLALGSEGRREQTIKTDIDNAIVYRETKGREYFLKLGEAITEILLEIGFPECPGKVMVSNPEWVKSLDEWKYTLEEWFSRPNAGNILKASIFLDFRAVYGNGKLSEELRDFLNRLAKNYRNFLVAMAQKVLETEPPINIFHRFVLEKSGEHKGELDLKRGGIFPITQGARILSLEKGLKETNTVRRIELLKDSIGKDFCSELIEAFKFLQTLRLKSQLDKIKRGRTPDNYVNPQKLTKFERDLLKDAFKVISKFQEMLGVHFRLRV
ncbi:putative nucleotidyltransferase substrate binding domain-containing protein [Phorcysia thermohydrogeniphila]|uniref:CBS domain-containing protein n=1 Tax=Phorcysia thermohydrogeniphila TaxID=936138 RepID=A0A4R1GCJ5_9BACT|nr:putative nucleotidyltransferase substrate binding domain-containing protein [Phorcysia thermohydrogeniphila]TCK03409.1 CBS domain-containing protein [Phorcysia thermohydrogeniphila]